MTPTTVRFPSPWQYGKLLAGLSLLAAFSQMALQTLAHSHWLVRASGEQILRALPVTSICKTVVFWLPGAAQVFSWCPWVDLAGTAIRVLCRTW